MSYWEFPAYVSVAERRRKNEARLEKMRMKDPHVQPVVIQGNTLARTWWGKAWNRNLERYADYDNRIGRGRSYVRHGAVLDLRVTPGEVRAKVQGSSRMHYSVTIWIDPIDKATWKEIKRACAGQLDSLQSMLSGKFPKSLETLFMTRGSGIFPSSKEIDFGCTCPDGAQMCKHVAAVLYGVGARLDEDPSIFFTLRKVDVADLVTETVKDATEELLEKANRRSSRVISGENLSDVFGIDMEEAVYLAPKRKSESEVVEEKPLDVTKQRDRAAKAASRRSEIAKKTAERIISREIGAPNVKSTDDGQSATQEQDASTDLERVASLLDTIRCGISISGLKGRTGLDEKRLYAIVHRLHKEGRIRRKDRGVYARVARG